VDNDGRVESVFAIGSSLYIVGANPGGASGQIEKVITPDGGLLGSPILADANGDGLAEIIVVSTSGMIYGIGRPASAGGAAATMTVASSSTLRAAVDSTPMRWSTNSTDSQSRPNPTTLVEATPPSGHTKSFKSRSTLSADTEAIQSTQPTRMIHILLDGPLAEARALDAAFDDYSVGRNEVDTDADRELSSTKVSDVAKAELVESVFNLKFLAW
jgi:hypothetical protein